MYLIVWSLFFSIAILSTVSSKSVNRISLFVFGFILVLFTGLRFYSGEDYQSYVWLYDITPSFIEDWTQVKTIPVEYGYALINFIFKLAGIESYLFLFVLSAVSLISKAYIFSKLSKISIISLFIYFSFVYYNSEFIQIRWALALSFIYFSILFYLHSKMYKAMLFLAIASSIHITSLLFFIILPLAKIAERYRIETPLFIVGICFLCLSPYIDITYLITSNFDFGGGGYFAIKLKTYLENVEARISWHVLFRYFASMIIVFILHRKYFYSNKYNKFDNYKFVKYQGALYTLFLVSSVFCFVFISFPILANRLYIFSDFLFALLIVNYVSCIKRFATKTIILIFVILVSFVYSLLLLNYMINSGNIYEYSTWWRMVA
ncbi:MAG: EpsG family protein [Rheinheimera sp.]|nr:EpsG family protein [Pseudoalteromonas sp. BSi20480]MAD75003.1 EpsG family protein [Rheinheimera sp.]GAA75670.1 hypothetical protein P20480_2139 [Pseudoalteromonas sp. BSi20480]|tara:strand:- start:1652 stop:2782 length:1131 start_codon:yes stop_codon:yes gene_type:complete